MRIFRCILLSGFCLLGFLLGLGQRVYSPNSVLATGNWYKLSVNKAGIYKIDVPFLNSLGLSGNSFSSNSFRLYGNGGQMLAEANSGNWVDDLIENAIEVIDGGDGIVSGTDYLLFYANGPDKWMNEAGNRFSHQKNLFSDKSFYFLSIGGSGKRIKPNPVINSPVVSIHTFSERYFHELDSINFLSSGKEWYGEEFSNAPGKTLTRDFLIPIVNTALNTPIEIRTNCIARSVGVNSRFAISVNRQIAGEILINSISGGQYDVVAQQNTMLIPANATQGNLTINYTYIPGSFNSQGWLNWFELFLRRNISLSNIDQLHFRDWQSVGNIAGEFVVNHSNAGTKVWEITNPFEPVGMQGALTGTEFRFVNSCLQLKEYIAFNQQNFLTPVAVGKISNQNLHNVVATDFLIITSPILLSQAQRLAQLHHQQNSLRTQVVTTEQVFNEFSSGSPDPTSLRDFVKMYWDRFGTNTADRPKYLLLFGDASFDYKDRIKNNSNLVPTFQNNLSLDPLSSYTSDDFFGFLDNNEDINSGIVVNLLDIGIGRVPAKNIDEAKNFVDKVEVYFSSQALGPWRNNLTFIADDEDGNLHLQDAEIISATAATASPVFNLQKIYLDAYKQESGAGGSHYPQANEASNNQVFNGTLIWNYNGHGGASRLAEETILDQQIVNNWNNPAKLPLFITATCDFAPYDNPIVNSLGENILLRPKTGAIALMTTTRVVFAFSNRILNDNYLRTALQADGNGRYKTLGEAIKEAKNFTYQSSGDITNNRKFTLLGDPAMSLGFPLMKVRPVRINGLSVSQIDTLSSTEKVTIEGEVTDHQGNLLNGFNGNIYSTVFDKPQTITTLANDPASQPTNFTTQSNIIFKGKATITNGRFSFSFKVPKDINYQYGNGKLSLYGENGVIDANGFFTGFIVGGEGNNQGGDLVGPEIKGFLNDEKFVNGGIVNQTPVLLVKLADSSGINTVGTGIGHDIVATLDNDNRRYFILNDFYESSLNSYQEGLVRFQLPKLEPGNHTLTIKAWDVLNNSNEITLEFTVANDEELHLAHVLNYPNPFTTSTTFWFEHNKPGEPLQVQLQIMTIKGRVIKTFQQTVITPGNRSTEISWDGKDEFGDKPGRGVYIYKLLIVAPNRKKKQYLGKLVIL